MPRPPDHTAQQFSGRLIGMQEVADAASPTGAGRIPMRQVFDLAKEFIGLPLTEIESLLEASDHVPPRRRGQHHGLSSPGSHLPRTTLRYAIEHLPPDLRHHYRSLKHREPD